MWKSEEEGDAASEMREAGKEAMKGALTGWLIWVSIKKVRAPSKRGQCGVGTCGSWMDLNKDLLLFSGPHAPTTVWEKRVGCATTLDRLGL